MKRFNKKLVYFRIILTLSPLIMASSANDCTKLTRIRDLYKGRPPKETLEEEDKLAMVEKFKKAIEEHNLGLDKSTRLPSSITLALQSLNVYSENVKKSFLL